MQSFNIIKEIKPKKTFRNEKVIGMFDLSEKNYIQKFEGNFDLKENWNIGLIVGNSGTGKSTIAKQLFKTNIFDFKYDDNSIIDNMPQNKSVEEIIKTLNICGFNTPTSYLKPYHVLSNGEKMRVDLANSLLQKNEIIVFDEYTSVIDRNVAKIASFATQKKIRELNKKFIAVSCHYDIEEWLMPDWVFDTNEMKIKYNERKYLRQPKLEFSIFETTEKRYYWELFSKYHYLNHSHNNASRVFVAYLNDDLCGIRSVLHFPHPKNDKIKRGHRLVILPDYQGLGLGNILSNKIAEYFVNNEFDYYSLTSSPS